MIKFSKSSLHSSYSLTKSGYVWVDSDSLRFLNSLSENLSLFKRKPLKIIFPFFSTDWGVLKVEKNWSRIIKTG
jgi:hypothetical protein